MIVRGQIFFANLNPVMGREQAGRRPVLVVSDDAINRQPLVVTVVLGTDARNVRRDYRTNVRVSATESGLPQDTVFLCFHLRSIDPERMRDSVTGRWIPAGHLAAPRMQEVEQAIRRVLALP